MTQTDPAPADNGDINTDAQAAFSGTREVDPRYRLDEPALERWLTQNVEGYAGPLTVRQFKGGQSNPTYELTTPGHTYVLRRKPPGTLLPSAHAVDREFTVISALHAQGYPVARPLCSVYGRWRHWLDVLCHGQGGGPGAVGSETARRGSRRPPGDL